MIVFDDMEPSEKVKVYDRGVEFAERPSQEEIRRILPAYRMGDVWTPHIPVKEALVTEVEHFARCITAARPASPPARAGCGWCACSRPPPSRSPSAATRSTCLP